MEGARWSMSRLVVPHSPFHVAEGKKEFLSSEMTHNFHSVSKYFFLGELFYWFCFARVIVYVNWNEWHLSRRNSHHWVPAGAQWEVCWAGRAGKLLTPGLLGLARCQPEFWFPHQLQCGQECRLHSVPPVSPRNGCTGGEIARERRRCKQGSEWQIHAGPKWWWESLMSLLIVTVFWKCKSLIKLALVQKSGVTGLVQLFFFHLRQLLSAHHLPTANSPG